MADTTVSDTTRGNGTLTAVIGWTMVVAVINLLYVAVLIPETAMGSQGRAVVDKMHTSWGIVAFVLVVIRLALWIKSPPQAPTGTSATVFGAAKDMSMAFYICVLLEGLIGPTRAWAEGFTVHVFNFGTLPNLLAAKYELRVVAGYFHSAISFFVTAIIPIGVVTAIVAGWRTRTPFYKMFPV